MIYTGKHGGQELGSVLTDQKLERSSPQCLVPRGTEVCMHSSLAKPAIEMPSPSCLGISSIAMRRAISKDATPPRVNRCGSALVLLSIDCGSVGEQQRHPRKAEPRFYHAEARRKFLRHLLDRARWPHIVVLFSRLEEGIMNDRAGVRHSGKYLIQLVTQRIRRHDRSRQKTAAAWARRAPATYRAPLSHYIAAM